VQLPRYTPGQTQGSVGVPNAPMLSFDEANVAAATRGRVAERVGESVRASAEKIAAAAEARQHAEDLAMEMELRTDFALQLADAHLENMNSPEGLKTSGLKLMEATLKRAQNQRVASKLRLEMGRMLGEKVVSAKYAQIRRTARETRGALGKYLGRLQEEQAAALAEELGVLSHDAAARHPIDIGPAPKDDEDYDDDGE
jgi:hypothetical protein